MPSISGNPPVNPAAYANATANGNATAQGGAAPAQAPAAGGLQSLLGGLDLTSMMGGIGKKNITFAGQEINGTVIGLAAAVILPMIMGGGSGGGINAQSIFQSILGVFTGSSSTEEEEESTTVEAGSKIDYKDLKNIRAHLKEISFIESGEDTVDIEVLSEAIAKKKANGLSARQKRLYFQKHISAFNLSADEINKLKKNGVWDDDAIDDFISDEGEAFIGVMQSTIKTKLAAYDTNGKNGIDGKELASLLKAVDKADGKDDKKATDRSVEKWIDGLYVLA